MSPRWLVENILPYDKDLLLGVNAAQDMKPIESTWLQGEFSWKERNYFAIFWYAVTLTKTSFEEN